jgi:glycosyltransferase involved in cell wall biosynthesis
MSSTTENILVSVCITTYCRPEGLRATLDCVIAQTHRKLQILISDDCSEKAGISSILSMYAKSDARITYFIQNANLGYSSNLKFLLDRVRGEFVIWMDDDDYYHPSFIESCLEVLRANPSASTALSYYQEVNELGFPAPGYPNQSKLLNRLTNKNKFVRIIYYLFAFDGYGYCNIYYGLHRRNILDWFDPAKFGFAVDMAMGMKLISISPIAVSQEFLYQKAVNNLKFYTSDKKGTVINNKNHFKSIEVGALSVLGDVKTSFLYCLSLRFPENLMILTLSPFWILSSFLIRVRRFFSDMLIS